MPNQNSAQKPFDKDRAKAFTTKVVDDMAGAVTLRFCAIGERLGLFHDLADQGPATSEEFAKRTDIDARYAREWLEGMASAGYLDFDPDNQQFTLPAEHLRPLADKNSPLYQGGLWSLLTYSLAPFEELVDAFKHGGGIPQSAYDPRLYDAMQSSSGLRYRNFLLGTWLPDMPDVVAMLERGVDVVDIGCGKGTALLTMAEAFPNSRYHGFDGFAPQVDGANAQAREKGLSDRVTFELLDASDDLPGDYDLIFTFDVIHDMARPREALKNIRRHLNSNGIYVMQEITAADERHENRGSQATLKYGMSITYCMTTSLANHGEGLGTLGMPERVVRELCLEAKFSEIRKLPCSNAFISLFEIRG